MPDAATQQTGPSAQQAAAAAATPVESRAFTLRALGLGLAGAIVVCGYAYFNDVGMRQCDFIGNHLPYTIYSAFLLFLLLVNPALRVATKVLRVHPLRPFSRGELVVMLALPLASGCLPNQGLMRVFTPLLAMPQHYGRNIPDWQNARPLQYVNAMNPNLVPKDDPDGRVYDEFVQGTRAQQSPPLSQTTFGEWTTKKLAESGAHFRRVPYSAWLRPALVWLPLVVIGLIFVLCLCRVVHRQWSENEHLSYPIAEFTHTLIRHDNNRLLNDVFYSRLFWAGLAVPLCIHLVNGWHLYDPRMIEIPVRWNLWWIWFNYLPFMHHGVGPHHLFFGGKLYFTVIALTYFLSQEISLSLALSLPLCLLATSLSYSFGHAVTWEEHGYMIFGAYVAMAAMILYTGRYYYLAVLRRAFLIKPAGDADADAAWACRGLVIAAAAFVAMLCWIGLDWLLASLVVLIFAIVFLVLARISAETGTPFVNSGLSLNSLIMAVFGPAALGPGVMYVLTLVGGALMADNRECLAPFAINVFRLGQRNGVSRTGLSRAMTAALLIGIVVAGLAVLWVIYDYGVRSVGSSQALATNVSRDIQMLKRSDRLEPSLTVSGLDRLSSELRFTQPNFVTFLLIGAALVLANSALHLNYTWWPIHTVLFLCWGTWPAANFTWSFLFGWLLKVSVLRIGGGRTYQDLKPLFIGVIAGDLLGGAFWLVFGIGWFVWTGTFPQVFRIFP